MSERTTEAARLSSLISTGTASDVTRLLREINAAAYSNRIRYFEAFDLSMQCAARLKAMPTPEQYAAVVAQRDELAKSLPIEELEPDMRAYNVLYKSHRNIRFVGQLVELTEQDILDMRNAGTKTVENIKERLRDVCGLTLKQGGES